MEIFYITIFNMTKILFHLNRKLYRIRINLIKFLLKKLFIYDLIDYITNRTKPIIWDNSIFVISISGIGDYVLMRNFLKELRDDKPDSRIILCAHSSIYGIPEFFDHKYVDQVIYVKKKKFISNIKYRFDILKAVRQEKYALAINAFTERENLVSEPIVKALVADEKIGFAGPSVNMSEKEYKKSIKNYDRLIEVSKDNFEFDILKEFFEKIINKKISIQKPCISCQDLNLDLPKEYIAIFPGANAHFRRWSPENFSTLINGINQLYDKKIILLGSKSDLSIASEISSRVVRKDLLIDLAGKTNLSELIFIICKADLLISNETVSVHLAVGTDTSVICISNGNYFGRFHPYPETIYRNCITIYPPYIEQNLHDKPFLKRTFSSYKGIDIDTIAPSRVLEQVEFMLNEKVAI
jgi:ADP-heptose:LPS heptosyltransferase